MQWDHLSQNVQCHSQAVIQTDVMKVLFTKCATCHSQSAHHQKSCDDTALSHKMCNVAHFLLVIGKDVMRLTFTKCAMSLTRCLP